MNVYVLTTYILRIS